MRQTEDPLIGTMIGRFRVERLLGQGGMGAVFEVLQPAIGKRMAVKVLHPEFAAKSVVVQRFFDEARAVNLIGHEGIVDITDFGTLADGRPFFFMEYLQGQTLEAFLRDSGPLRPIDAIALFRPVLSALAAAHSKGIVHRDLKPDNIFLCTPPNRGPATHYAIKLLDFGIAKLRDREANSEGHTETGVVLGTPTYMSPEQAEGKTQEADHRTDIYSLGVILYRMLAGVPPFAGTTFAELIVQHTRHPPPTLRSKRENIPRSWEGVIARALAKRPDDRFHSVEDFAEAVEKALGEREGSLWPRRAIAAMVIAGGAVALGSALAVVTRSEQLEGPELVSTNSAAKVQAENETPPGEMESEVVAHPKAEAGDLPDAGHVGDAGVAEEEPRPTDKKRKKGTATLLVKARPWAHVYLDGKRIGQTPLKQQVKAGVHKLRLRNDTSNQSKRYRIDLERGETHVHEEKW